MNDPNRNYLENASLSTTSEAECSLDVAHGIAQITVNAMIALFGIFGNVLVCLAVVTNTVLRQSSNYLLGSLAVADLIASLICEPLFLDILIRKSLYDDCAWMIVERVYFDVSNFSAAASVLHMSAISIDRFIAIVFPLRHRTCMKGAGIKALLISCWLVTILLFLLSKYYRAPIAKKAFINLAIFIFCFLIILVAYILIVISLLQQKRREWDCGCSLSKTSRPVMKRA